MDRSLQADEMVSSLSSKTSSRDAVEAFRMDNWAVLVVEVLEHVVLTDEQQSCFCSS